ncbi:hypothetical protein BKI52_41300 [marine bacterium AO1-C]|nr:hypothetical protein BKI52_41300 [marine bacterium AO1-C]
MKQTLEKIKPLLAKTLSQNKLVTFLTGAGVSAESGVPTYRGSDGIWVEGTRNYKPQDFATLKFFKNNPAEVWKFMLYRKTTFRDVQPNAGHIALANIEQLLQDRFRLITQNIDRLHHRAGNSSSRTYEIHGSLETVRCSEECSNEIYPFPIDVSEAPYDASLVEKSWEVLKCLHCGSITRPNVLMFDEYYDERLYKMESAIETALNTGILFIVGTSGATNLPNHIASTARFKESSIVDINLEDNDFTAEVADDPNGLVLRGKSGEILPKIEQILRELLESENL